jgi:hypothetical protein
LRNSFHSVCFTYLKHIVQWSLSTFTEWILHGEKLSFLWLSFL